jgi:hypothetical protein
MYNYTPTLVWKVKFFILFFWHKWNKFIARRGKNITPAENGLGTQKKEKKKNWEQGGGKKSTGKHHQVNVAKPHTATAETATTTTKRN